MSKISKFHLDAELRSQLNFEFIPIYEGGIISSVTAAVPFEDGALFSPGVDRGIYVRFKATPFMVSTSEVWVYFSFISGSSTVDFDFEVRYQIIPPGAGATTSTAIPVSVTPDGTTNLQTTIGVINSSITAWKIPAPVQKHSLVRFEIVRKGSTDTNPDDLKILDVSYATIPTYQTLASFDNGLVQPLVPIPTGTNILNNKGSLLSHDGVVDLEILYPGDAQILCTDITDPIGVVWKAQSVVIATQTTADKGITGTVVGDNTGLTITAAPARDSYVRIVCNGIEYLLGSNNKTKDYYFSGDAGVTSRTFADITAGDSLFKGTGLPFAIASTDVYSLYYDIIT